MVGRKVRDAADAAQLLDAAEASDLERADWARRHGISPRSLNAWRLILGRHRREGPSLRVVALGPETGTAKGHAPLVVRYGAFSVEVDASFDENLLRRVLTAVASC